MTHDELRALIFSFPGVEDGASYGEPSFKVAGKFLTWIWPKPGDSIVVHLDNLDERELLIEMDPATFHFTDHHRDHPLVLARIATVDPAWLTAMMEKRWRRVAPRGMVKAFDQA